MKKSTRKIKAQETLDIINSGSYRTKDNIDVILKDELKEAIEASKYYDALELDDLLDKLVINRNYNTNFEVTPEDSVSAIHRLYSEGERNIMCLNFASAKNPGGGFLNGALAQEESLAVSSSLYSTQMACYEFYQTHRDMKSCVYTDGMIYSPNVPVFRNNKGYLLQNFSKVNFITSAAVNTGVVKRKELEVVDKIPALMEDRIRKMIALSYSRENDTLLLGAWGCGVFQNDPEIIAKLFKKILEGEFKNCFKRIVFAIYSRNEKFITPFKESF